MKQFCSLPTFILATLFVAAGCSTKSITEQPFGDGVAFDAALSWVSAEGNFQNCPSKYHGNTFRYATDQIKKTGVRHVRERLSWGGTNKERNVYDFVHFLDNARYFHKNGIGITDVFHDAAPYARGKQKLPRDLIALYDYCKQTAKTFGKCMEIWEFWNEEDIDFAPEGAWDYAAAMKAASLGWRDGGFKGLVANGALCRDDWDGYNETMFLNDVVPYIDVFNTHFYSAPSSYSRRMDATRKFLRRHGADNLAVIVTECGTNQEGNSTIPSTMEGFTMHSPIQEQIQSEFCIKSQILSRMEGVLRNYFFIFGAYSERNGTKDWGLMRRDGSVKPAVEAYTELMNEVGRGKLAGEVQTDNEKVCAFLFDMPNDIHKLVYWAKTEIDTTEKEVSSWKDEFIPSTLKLPNGQTFALSAQRRPKYAILPSVLHIKRKPLPLGNVGAQKVKDKDLHIVMRADFNPEDGVLNGSKSCWESKSDKIRFTLEVWNLDNHVKKGTVRHLATGTIEGLPDEMTIPGRSHKTFKLTYIPQKDSPKTITLEGTFGEKKTTTFHVPIL